MFNSKTFTQNLPSPLSLQEFSDCTFQQCDFSNHDLSGAIFIDCTFTDCNFSNTKIKDSSWQTAIFNNCKLLGLGFSEINALLVDWKFIECRIELCYFNEMNIKNSHFLDCDIIESDFTKADLTSSAFTNSSLKKSIFQNTDLSKTDFLGATNYYIDPTQNKLTKASFAMPEVLALLGGFGIEIK